MKGNKVECVDAKFRVVLDTVMINRIRYKAKKLSQNSDGGGYVSFRGFPYTVCFGDVTVDFFYTYNAEKRSVELNSKVSVSKRVEAVYPKGFVEEGGDGLSKSVKALMADFNAAFAFVRYLEEQTIEVAKGVSEWNSAPYAAPLSI